MPTEASFEPRACPCFSSAYLAYFAVDWVFRLTRSPRNEPNRGILGPRGNSSLKIVPIPVLLLSRIQRISRWIGLSSSPLKCEKATGTKTVLLRKLFALGARQETPISQISRILGHAVRKPPCGLMV